MVSQLQRGSSGGGKGKRKKTRVGISAREEDLIKARLRVTFPSEPWVESAFVRIEDVNPEGDPIVYRFHNPNAFPPKPDARTHRSEMLTCPACGRYVPSIHTQELYYEQAGEELIGRCCIDHAPMREHEAYGPSPSAVAIRALQMRNLRLDKVKLEPETKADLRREIFEHKLAEKRREDARQRNRS